MSRLHLTDAGRPKARMYGTPGTPPDGSSPQSLRRSSSNLFRFLGCFRGVFLSLRAQFSRGLVIAPMVRRGGCVGVGGVDVKVRCTVMFVLGHCILHIPANALALASGVSHLTIGRAEQSDTAPAAPYFVSRVPGLTDVK